MTATALHNPTARRTDAERRTGDARNIVMYAALALLPVDGLSFGFQMPYWSPFSPLLFLLYACLNWRRARIALRAYPAVLPFLLALMGVSVFGWATVGVNAVYLTRTVVALACAAATLISLHIAFTQHVMDRNRALTTVIAAYTAAFLVGVFTWLGQPDHLDWSWSYRTLSEWYLRQYFIVRPQFLFAEPSYIGMHVFGVLLPLYWMTRDRRLTTLIIVFTLGSILMGAGVRILLDTAVAGILCAIAAIPWKRVARSKRALAATITVAILLCAGGTAALLTNRRIRSLAEHGILSGDPSMSARIFRSLAPLEGLLRDLPHTLLGYGAGNIGAAITAGYDQALILYTNLGGTLTGEIAELRLPFGPTANRAGNVFTMSAYASFATEFGLPMLVIAAALILRHITTHHAWSKPVVCWLILLAYLYTQFEAYAFYALPLLIWTTGKQENRTAANPTQSKHYN